jgi:hypothetical protein
MLAGFGHEGLGRSGNTLSPLCQKNDFGLARTFSLPVKGENTLKNKKML